MSDFSPRECQLPMIQTITGMARANVFATPGTGKTSATLVALDSLAHIGAPDVWPVLIVAPLRVANLVWLDEVKQWSRFSGLRVSRILGTAEQRKKAVRRPAEIYTINYENLLWLHKLLGHENWFFKTIVADECTRIKGHRTHFRHYKRKGWALYANSGSKNACALMQHAPRSKRWINLTGTPAPNGVEDLWGIQWPIDFGKALGRTHSAFIDRWFRMKFGSSKEQARYEPMPGAEDEIVQRIQPCSVSVDAYDYFDIERPVEQDIKVELPEEARRLYSEMHEQSIAELQTGDKALGVNKGSAVMKCRQIASGHLRDVNEEWHTVHSAKLDALQELRDKTNEPILVAYYFKEDAKAVLGRFKDAELLPKGAKQADVQSRWNKGKIPILLAHPQSAGHGLNLQWGGRVLCIYTPDWNYEYYAQIIERIGPTRQAQAGLDRLVYIYRLIAKGTWDAVVARRVGEKMTTEQMVKDGLKVMEEL